MQIKSIKKGIFPLFLVFLAIGAAHAGTTGTEFQSSSDRFEGYATGYLAKAAAFGATGIGLLVSAWKQSLMPLGTGVGIAIFAVIVNGIINATLTAVI